MNTTQEKAMHFLTALADVYRDEDNRELEAFSKMEFSDDFTEDVTAILLAMKVFVDRITGDDGDILDATAPTAERRMIMTAICKMTGKETELPCSASGCPLFGDCIVEFQKERRKSKPKQTNADRIRAMSDEELAEFLESTHSNMAIKLGSEYIVRDKEYIGIWLTQPAEGADNG
jgi:hypothetical protein